MSGGTVWGSLTRQKLVPGLSRDVVYVILCLAVLTQYQHVTDTPADRDTQTHDDG